MPTVRFTNDDFLMSKVIKPGWYHSLVKAVNQKAAKTDGSAVYNPQIKIVEPGDYFGVPVQDWFSEKALGAGAIRFIRACSGEEPRPDQNYELANGVGKVIKIHVSNSLNNGKVVNQIDDYDIADPAFKIAD